MKKQKRAEKLAEWWFVGLLIVMGAILIVSLQSGIDIYDLPPKAYITTAKQRQVEKFNAWVRAGTISTGNVPVHFTQTYYVLSSWKKEKLEDLLAAALDASDNGHAARCSRLIKRAEEMFTE